uniref:Mitochondrial amidoxime reducing component 2 n=1 Tax=Cacopsylla melanoneura TaxID=428564 RepID=A0A8D9BD55_9HEMI
MVPTIQIPTGPTLLVLVSGVTSLFIVWMMTRQSDRNKRTANSYNQIPIEWKQVGIVTGLHIYPLKAGHGLSVDRAYCEQKGLTQIGKDGVGQLSDRCFILFDRVKKKYITNLDHPRLILVKTVAVDRNLIQFSVHNDNTYIPVTVNMKPVTSGRGRTVHTIAMYEKDVVHAVDCGDEASQWFSRYLLGVVDDNIRLGFTSDEQRKLDGTIYEKYRRFYGDHMSNEDMGKFSYLASYMVMNEKSVNDLNEKLTLKGETEVSTENFRGNLILSTNQAYEEDAWTWLRINSVILRVMKPCTRCRMTTLDPETGRFHPRQEPLATLRSYRELPSEEARKLDKYSPRLGVYCGLYVEGTVQVNDTVYAATTGIRDKAVVE